MSLTQVKLTSFSTFGFREVDESSPTWTSSSAFDPCPSSTSSSPTSWNETTKTEFRSRAVKRLSSGIKCPVFQSWQVNYQKESGGSEYWTSPVMVKSSLQIKRSVIQKVIWIPDYFSLLLNTELIIVRYSNVSVIWMLIIPIPLYWDVFYTDPYHFMLTNLFYYRPKQFIETAKFLSGRESYSY